MKMIVGLGNPGKEYENTRHNIGFMVIDDYAKRYNITFKTKYNGLFAKVYRNGEYYVLLKPLSFMNLSGTVVRKFANYFKIKPEDILVIHDDLDMPVGKIKIKAKGSSGGHNGIKNIIENLGTEEFAHFKVGIDNNKEITTKDYVLGKFNKIELDKLNKIIGFSSNIIDDFLDLNIDKLMSKYNGEDYEIK
jgi:PTH1 family peptidyl-tRNA hydrolase